MPTLNDTPKQKLSLNLPADIAKRVKIEALERGKGVTEATIVLEALELHWRFEKLKVSLPKLQEQILANVPLHEMDFGMAMSLSEKLSLMEMIKRES